MEERFDIEAYSALVDTMSSGSVGRVHTDVHLDLVEQQDLLLLSDPTAMTYLLTNDPYACYEKPAELRGDLLTHLGKGLIFAEGVHTRL